MIYHSTHRLLEEAARTGLPLWQIIISQEKEESGIPIRQLRQRVEDTYAVMKNAATAGLSPRLFSVSGLTGGDADKYYRQYRDNKSLLGGLSAKAMTYALATSGYNAAMGVIVAAPTAGAAGILPGVIIAAQEEYGFSDSEAIDALIVAGGIGAVIATRATISGAVGGCQAECGSGGAMAAAALCHCRGGTPEQVIHAAALALKNTLGLACDPVAGLVEVPCIKRNGIYAVLAIAAADMALSGIESFVPLDEVIDAMYQIGINMPACLRETGEGGLAASPTAIAAKERLFG